jgi:hypothetical protein
MNYEEEALQIFTPHACTKHHQQTRVTNIHKLVTDTMAGFLDLCEEQKRTDRIFFGRNVSISLV